MHTPAPASMSDGLPRPQRLIAIAAISAGTALVVIDGAIASASA